MVILFGLVPRTIPFSLFSFDWYRVQACSFFFVDPFRSHPIQTTMCCICFSRCWTWSRASSNPLSYHTTTHSVHFTLSSTMADVAGATVVRTRHLSFQLHFSWNDSSSQFQSIVITTFSFLSLSLSLSFIFCSFGSLQSPSIGETNDAQKNVFDLGAFVGDLTLEDDPSRSSSLSTKFISSSCTFEHATFWIKIILLVVDFAAMIYRWKD